MIPLCVVAITGFLALLALQVDWTPGRYKVMYHSGLKIGLKTKMETGWLVLEDGQVNIRGKQALSLPLQSVQSAELFRLHRVGRMIRLVHDQGTLYVSVVRFCIGGRFAMVDFFKTGALASRLGPGALPATSA